MAEAKRASVLDRAAAPKAATGAGAGLIALVGAVAALGLFTTTPEEESGRVVTADIRNGELVILAQRGPMYLRAYRDIAGIWTICDGDTAGVGPETIETPKGCQRRLERQLIAHAAGVLKCTPALAAPGRDFQRQAAIGFAYNVGVAAWCESSSDRHFDAGRWRQGCDALMLWNKARVNGVLRPVAGLTARRARERATCLRGL